MIWINFSNKWDDKDGKYLEWKRIRWGRLPHSGQRVWTPFCHVWFKHHPPKRILSSRKLTLTEVSKNQQQRYFNLSEYRWGLANGLILAESIMNDRPPHFLDKPKKWLGTEEA